MAGIPMTCSCSTQRSTDTAETETPLIKARKDHERHSFYNSKPTARLASGDPRQ
jgi:hypothetical protein